MRRRITAGVGLLLSVCALVFAAGFMVVSFAAQSLIGVAGGLFFVWLFAWSARERWAAVRRGR